MSADLKEEVRQLLDQLPDNSPLLGELKENIRLNLAIQEAYGDVEEGLVYHAKDFIQRVEDKWHPRITL